MTAVSTVSLIIPTHNRVRVLRKTLRALEKQTIKPSEIIVVEDGDELANLPTRLCGEREVTVLHQTFNGFRAGQCRNKGAVAANGDLLVFIDDDIITPSPFIASHLQHQHHTPGIVAGFRSRVSAGQLRNNHYQLVAAKPDPKLAFSMLASSYPAWTLFSSCNFSIPKQMFFRLGGFDEDFVGWGFEDTEFAFRASSNGCPITFMTDCIPIHIDDPNEDTACRFKEYRQNARRFMQKYADDRIVRFTVLRDLWRKMTAYQDTGDLKSNP